MLKLEGLLQVNLNSFFEDSPVCLNTGNKKVTGIIVKITNREVRIARRPPYNNNDSRRVYLEIYKIALRKNGIAYLDLERTQLLLSSDKNYDDYNLLLLDNQEIE
jgi:hypothetical protein